MNPVDSKTTLDWHEGYGRLTITTVHSDGMQIASSLKLGEGARNILYSKKADELGHEWVYITWQKNGNRFEFWDKPISFDSENVEMVQEQEPTEWYWENNEWRIKG